MANVFVSVLGTTNYVPCSYNFGDEVVVKNARFVQEATVSRCCKDWSESDRILIFTTDEAEKKNWLDNGQIDPETHEPIIQQGLKSRLDALGLNAAVTNVKIPEGKTESEIWEIFNAIVGRLGQDDEVVFDITHAFRSITMLVMVVLNYAKVVKGVKLLGIYYGAFEVLSSPKKVEQMPMEERPVPIFDLTPFDRLMDWTTAIDRFVGAGDASLVRKLADDVVMPRLNRAKGGDRAAKAVKKIAKTIDGFAISVSTCRGRSISGAAAKLKRDLVKGRSYSDELIPALSPLLGSVQTKLEGFVGDEVRDGVAAARWCLEHNLIQQGFTILQETLVSYLIHQIGEESKLVKNRKIATESLGIVKRNLAEKFWQGEAAKDVEKTRKFVALLGSRQDLQAFFLGPSFERLKEFRNDLNHGGYTGNTHGADEFRDVLSQILSEAEKFL